MSVQRIALIARHYPPAVSGGARRPADLVRALRAAGVIVDVIAPSLPDGESGLAIPHPNRDPATGPPAAPTLRDHARELLLWPDPDIRWSLRAAHGAATLPRPDWIVTTSPPESLHAAGLWLKKRTGARWAADFRDHWLERPHRRERAVPWRRAGEGLIARRWLARTDAAFAVDESIAAELGNLGAPRVAVLPHAADPPPAPLMLPAETINVVHTGAVALSDPEADIGAMLAAFAAAHARNPALRLHLAGRLTDTERTAIAASPAAAAIVDRGVLPLDRARALQAGADALIFVASVKMHVPPSKIVEYLATDLPIIACGEGPWRADPRVPAGSPVDALAALTKGARVAGRARAPTPEAVAQMLLAMLEAAP